MNWWWKILAWWYKPPVGIRVVKVLVIDDDVFEYAKWDPETFVGKGWETAIIQHTGKPLTPNGRVEIRYMDGSTKKRVVLYPGQECDPTFPKPPRVFYLSATLVPRGDDTPRNVLGRVQKYHGSTLRCASHMFPFDDEDYLKEAYSHIKTVDLFFAANKIGFEVQQQPT